MRPLQRFLPAVVLAAGSAAGFAWSYPCWPDVLVDSGRELYIPWRLLQGQVLYRDIAYFNGPLSPYVNAAAMAAMGVSVRSLVVVNCLVIVAVIAMLYWLARQCAGRFAATMAALTFILLLGFNQLTEYHGYNWVLPYSHEMTHGVALSLASLCALIAFARRPSPIFLLAAGTALGLAFLTKVEIFVAAAATNLVLLAILLPPRRRLWADLGLWGLGLIFPVALAAAALRLVLPWRDALAGAAGAWQFVLTQLRADDRFYRWVMGIDAPVKRLTRLLAWSCGYLLLLGVPVLACRFVRRGEKAVALLAFFLAAAALALIYEEVQLNNFVLPLPLAMAVMIVVAGVGWHKTHSPAAAARLGLAVLGLTLLAKTILHVNIFHYGFGLTVPALALVAIVLFDNLPAAINRAWGSPGGKSGEKTERRNPALIFQAVALAWWVGVVAVHAKISIDEQRKATTAIGQDGDSFMTAPDRGEKVRTILKHLHEDAKPGDTMAALPEGIMLNYLARMVNPTPYVNFMPVELAMFGQDRVLDALQGHPPEFIILVEKDTTEYGYHHFGREYGQEILRWVLLNYHPLGTAGGRPFINEGFGIMLMQRNEKLIMLK